MKGRFVLAPRAQADLEEIWNYTERRWGSGQAEIYIRLLWQHIGVVAAHPMSGRACFEVREGYYKYRAGSHFLFYRLTHEGIDVVRILHERMDYERHL